MSLLFALFLSFSLFASDSLEFRVQSLLRDNNIEEAAKTLKVYSSKNNVAKDSLYYKLLGQIALKKEDYKETEKHLLRSLSIKYQDSTALALSQAYLKNNKPRKALNKLRQIRKKNIQSDLLYSQALWETGKSIEAVSYLENTKKKKYKSYDLIERQKYIYLYKLGKIKRIFDESYNFLKKSDQNSSEVALQVVFLLKERDAYLAEKYFDMILTLRPKDPVLLRERGVLELEKRRTYIAADFFSRASHIDKKYAFDAAATYLSLGMHAQALFFNQKVKDNKKRLLQLFTIHLDSENYEYALSLKYELEKHDLLDQGKVSYALAYAAFKAKDYKAFDDCFSKVTSQVYIAKVLKLKEILDSCRDDMGLECAFS